MTYTTPAIIPWDLPPPDSCTQSDAYRQALAHIYGYSERKRSPAEIALGRAHKLVRMRALLELIGTPQAEFATILVAGTKGKGSMAAFLSAILHAAGFRVGRYTQPHLYSYRERTWAAGAYATEEEVVGTLEAMRPALETVERAAAELGPLTTFDVGAAQTLLHFGRAGVEIAVIEVGVGGLNDATNVLEPILGLIGPIGFDHMATLGSTLPEIARHKAGIMRAGIDVVSSRQAPEARVVIDATAAQLGARVHYLGQAVSWEGDTCAGSFAVRGPLIRLDHLYTPLRGPHQRDNAALALAAAALLDRHGWPLPATAMRAGIERVSWPGRFQTVLADPLTVVDGAHNEAAARALRACLDECVPGRSVILVLGMSADKDAPAFLRELAPIVRQVVVTRARHERVYAPEELAGHVRTAGLSLRTAPTAAEAVMEAWKLATGDDVILVTGSLFLVGDVLEWLQNRGAEHA